GLLITVFITPIIGARAVIPVLSVLMIVTNVSRICFFFSSLDARVVATIAATAVPGAIVGATAYVNLDQDAIQALLGAVLVLSVPLRRYVAGKRLVPGTWSLLAFGAGFGFLSSVTVGAGILLIPMLLGAGLAGPALLVSDAAIGLIVNLTKVVMFGTYEVLTWPLVLMALAMGLCTVPGTWVASWIVKRTDLRIHTVFMEILVVAGGLSMIRRAIASAWGGE
ncbi:MAG TPA: sulfite exporter TauE/SafE family protein, partial [Thermodesulfobacteriota bacterium]